MNTECTFYVNFDFCVIVLSEHGISTIHPLTLTTNYYNYASIVNSYNHIAK